MNLINIKLEDTFLKQIDSQVKSNNYHSRTEFIREAMRDKLKELEKEELKAHFEKYFGKAKTKTSYAQERNIREQVGREYAKKFGIKLD